MAENYRVYTLGNLPIKTIIFFAGNVSEQYNGGSRRRTPTKVIHEKLEKSIEKLYKVNVIKVNTLLSKDRFKTVRGKIAKKSGYKKAIITLKEGQSIDIAAGI